MTKIIDWPKEYVVTRTLKGTRLYRSSERAGWTSRIERSAKYTSVQAKSLTSLMTRNWTRSMGPMNCQILHMDEALRTVEEVPA